MISNQDISPVLCCDNATCDIGDCVVAVCCSDVVPGDCAVDVSSDDFTPGDVLACGPVAVGGEDGDDAAAVGLAVGPRRVAGTGHGGGGRLSTGDGAGNTVEKSADATGACARDGGRTADAQGALFQSLNSSSESVADAATAAGDASHAGVPVTSIDAVDAVADGDASHAGVPPSVDPGGCTAVPACWTVTAGPLSLPGATAGG